MNVAPDRTNTTIDAHLRTAANHLAASGSESPRLDAEVLLGHVLGVDRAALFLRHETALQPTEAAAFDALVRRRASGEPVAYLTGHREFMALPFAVNADVLIPRPETELLVEWALDRLRLRPAATVVDVGAGSGAIAVSLAAHADPTWSGTIIAADVSPAALAVAARNRAGLLSGTRRRQVQLVRGSLLEWCGGPIDLVLANLPYLTPAQIAANPSLKAEPALALDGGREGLDLVEALVADLPRVLAPTGAAGLELDQSQTGRIARRLGARFPKAQVATLHDLAGWPRHVVMWHPHDGR